MPQVYKFALGDRVVYTNEFGVCWGVKTITAHSEAGMRRQPYTLRPAYQYEGTDTPWCPVEETRLRPATLEDITHSTDRTLSWFQEQYGRQTTLEERASLLDSGATCDQHI